MGSFSESFNNLTIGQLKKLTEDYEKLQEVVKKQEETIKKLKIKYPNAKIDEQGFDMQKFLDEECKI